MDYRPELDGIRAFAVLAVVAFHSDLKPATGGWLGVDIFFVLSGFLITALLVREWDRDRTVDLRRFWIRRLLRLYPALVFALVLGLCAYRTLGDDGSLLGYLRTAASAGFYVENFVWGLGGDSVGQFGHTWSLAVEMQFYLVWPPLLLWLLGRTRNVVPWIALGVLITYGLYLLQSGAPDDGVIAFPAAYYLPWTRAFELLLGALVAARLSQRPTPDPADSTPRRWTGWLIGLAFGVLLLAAWTDSVFVRPEAIAWESPAAALLTVALIVHLDRVRNTGVGRLLAWKPVAWIGLVSYGVYLFHYPIIRILKLDAGIDEAKVMFLLALPITLALAAISHRYVERPALRLKSSLAGRSVEQVRPQPID